MMQGSGVAQNLSFKKTFKANVKIAFLVVGAIPQGRKRNKQEVNGSGKKLLFDPM